MDVKKFNEGTEFGLLEDDILKQTALTSIYKHVCQVQQEARSTSQLVLLLGRCYMT